MRKAGGLFRLKPFLALLMTVAVGGLSWGNEEGKSVSSGEALKNLKEGSSRYVSGALIHPRADQKRRSETASGQKPFAAVLSCSDSRVPPETVFDQGIGDLFVIRVAGNVANSDEIATAEYGAEHLGISLILVLGHTSCGAVTAVVNGAKLEGSLPLLLANIRGPAGKVRSENPGKDPKELVPLTVTENVYQTMRDLILKSPILYKLVSEKKLSIQGAVYHIDNGKTDWLGEYPGQKEWMEHAAVFNPETGEGMSLNRILKLASAKEFLFAAVLPLVILTALFLFLYKIFLSEKRWLRNLRLRGRLVATMLIMTLVPAGVLYYCLGLGFLWSPLNVLVPFWISLGLAFIFAFYFAAKHYTAFRHFYESLKQKEQEGGNG